MTYIVHVTAVVEGDLERIEELINEYRYNCLQNQSGMKGFYVCRPADHPNIFLYTQIFKDIDAHRAHIESDDPRNFFAKMEEEGFEFQGRWMAGKEIDSVPDGQLLN
jgi:quinol monooxygenase YgiN